MTDQSVKQYTMVLNEKFQTKLINVLSDAAELILSKLNLFSTYAIKMYLFNYKLSDWYNLT